MRRWPSHILLAATVLSVLAAMGVEPDLRTHETPSIYGTVTALGSVGREIEGLDAMGRGFGEQGEGSSLWIGSLWAATDLNYVCNRDYEADANPEWRRVRGVFVTTTGEADQEFETVFDDGGHAQPRGLTVRLRSRSWNALGEDRFLILDYTVLNQGTQILSDLQLGLFADMDVGFGASDSTLVEAERGLIYTYDKGLNPPGGVAGIAWLGEAAARLTAIRNEDYVHANDYMLDADKLAFLRGELQFDTVDGDGSQLIALGPFVLAPGDSLELPFAMLHTRGEAAFRAAVLVAQQHWQQIRDARQVDVPVRSFSDLKSRF